MAAMNQAAMTHIVNHKDQWFLFCYTYAHLLSFSRPWYGVEPRIIHEAS